MKKNKLFFVLIASMLSFTTLTGCGDNAAQGGGQGNDNSSANGNSSDAGGSGQPSGDPQSPTYGGAEAVRALAAVGYEVTVSSSSEGQTQTTVFGEKAMINGTQPVHLAMALERVLMNKLL